MRRALRYRNSDTNRPIFRNRRHIALPRQRRYAACLAGRAALPDTWVANRLHRILSLTKPQLSSEAADMAQAKPQNASARPEIRANELNSPK